MLFASNIGMRVLYSLPVILLFLIIAGLYYCYLYGFLLILPTANVVISGILFHISLVLLIWSYLMSVITDPGTIPNNFEPVQDGFPEEGLNVNDLKNVKISICKLCNAKRPPRTHHCSHCGRCVLKRDHHCPWVANCVGFYNYRYFLQFLSYTTTTSLILSFSCLGTNQMNGWGSSVESLVGFIMGLMIAAGIGGFAVFHFYLACNNVTSTEFKPKKRFNTFYDKDWKSNCEQIFGKSLLGYFLPVRTGYGVDPTCYPVRIRNTMDEVLNYENKIFV